MAQNFEIPQQVRELAEKNVQAAQTAYGQMMEAMSQAMSMWSTSMPSNDMTAGFKAVQDRATQIAKKNADAAFSLANEIATRGNSAHRAVQAGLHRPRCRLCFAAQELSGSSSSRERASVKEHEHLERVKGARPPIGRRNGIDVATWAEHAHAARPHEIL